MKMFIPIVEKILHRGHKGLAKRIVREIIVDLLDRKGFRQMWEQTDEEIRDEIILAWEQIVIKRLS